VRHTPDAFRIDAGVGGDLCATGVFRERFQCGGGVDQAAGFETEEESAKAFGGGSTLTQIETVLDAKQDVKGDTGL
jgi:hypothetical protein